MVLKQDIKTLIPDVDLFILTEGKSDYWNWDLNYFTRFETDPVRYLTCHETYNATKKDKVEKNEKPKVDVAKKINAAVPYYEGMVKIEGSHGGVGFLELTGY